MVNGVGKQQQHMNHLRVCTELRLCFDMTTGNESLSVSDVQDILEEVYPDSPYAKNVLKEWERPQKKRHVARVDGDTAPDSQKKDSGLGSDGSNKDDGDEIIYKGPRKYVKYPYANEPGELKGD